MLKKSIKKAVIPCAGFGTRFLPVTKTVAKEMLPVVDTPALHLIVKELVDSGIEEILIILSRNKKGIEDYFDRTFDLEELLKKNGKDAELELVQESAKMAKVFFVRQQEMLGTAHAIAQAEAFCEGEPFVVCFGDDVIYTGADVPASKQLIDAYEKTGKLVLGVQKTPPEIACTCGVVKPGKTDGRITEMLGIVEKPSIDELPSELTSLGRFVFTPDIFDYIRKTEASKTGEYYIIDTIDMIAKIGGAIAYEFEGKRYDLGSKLGFMQANIEYMLRRENLAEDLKKYLLELVKTF